MELPATTAQLHNGAGPKQREEMEDEEEQLISVGHNGGEGTPRDSVAMTPNCASDGGRQSQMSAATTITNNTSAAEPVKTSWIKLNVGGKVCDLLLF